MLSSLEGFVWMAMDGFILPVLLVFLVVAVGVVVDEPAFRERFHVFEDRSHAGVLLAGMLEEYRGCEGCLVLAIPAGGVEVAVPLCRRLGVRFDLAVTRKIHIPWNREAGFGAVTWRGSVLINRPLLDALGLTWEEVERCVEEEREAIERRLRAFRGDVPPLDLEGRVVIVVDDGMASGFSMLATVREVRGCGVGEVVVAVPTASSGAISLVRPHADRVFCLNVRSGPVFAVADAYRKWYDLTDEDVVRLLREAGGLFAAHGPHLGGERGDG